MRRESASRTGKRANTACDRSLVPSAAGAHGPLSAGSRLQQLNTVWHTTVANETPTFQIQRQVSDRRDGWVGSESESAYRPRLASHGRKSSRRQAQRGRQCRHSLSFICRHLDRRLSSLVRLNFICQALVRLPPAVRSSSSPILNHSTHSTQPSQRQCRPHSGRTRPLQLLVARRRASIASASRPLRRHSPSTHRCHCLPSPAATSTCSWAACRTAPLGSR